MIGVFAILILGANPAFSENQTHVSSYVQSLGNAPKKYHPSGSMVEFLADPSQHKSTKGLFMAKLTIQESGTVPEHTDSSAEYLYVLEGSGEITIDGQRRKIQSGDTVFMKAGARVSFQAGPKKVKVLQIFSPPGPERKYESWFDSLEGASGKN